MLLKELATDSLIEILSVEELVNPVEPQVSGRSQAGQEEQESEKFEKKELVFPSGEKLPLCWVDAEYRQKSH